MQKVKGKLVLKDGSVYEGELYGNRNAVGEVVFTTGMSGYQETLTDPSYCGQIVVMTYPLVGNYGTNPLFNQGPRCFFQGYVVSDLCDFPVNWRSEGALLEFLEKENIPVLTGVDTRAITRKLRNYGVLKGVLVPAEMSDAEVRELLATPDQHDQVRVVSTKEKYTLGEGGFHVAVMDYGIKRNILQYLVSFGCHLTVYPAYTSAEDVLRDNPDGIFLSNGPGDPKDLPEIIENIRKFMGTRPLFGICLGHQLLALANDYDTYKMKFGHRGINHPVRDLVEHKICISSQNHGYAVDEKSLDDRVVISNVSLNDNTIEGLIYKEVPAFTVQYHPEACPGPGGHEYLFQRFVHMMGGRR